MRRLWLWLVVVGCFAGAYAASSQPGDCQPGALAAAFRQAFDDVVAQADRSLVYADAPVPLHDDRYPIDDDWDALLGMSSGSVLPPSETDGAPQFWIFHVTTEAQAESSLPPTIQFPQTPVTAIVNGKVPRGARLRAGPSTEYEQVGTALPYAELTVAASVRLNGYDWLSVGAGGSWIRGDLVHVNLPDALATQRIAVSWQVDAPPYADAERRERCPLPSALLIQTEPGRVVAYDFNGLTLLQSGTAVITYDNFRPASGASATRFFFTNVRGMLQAVASGSPVRVTDPGLTFAVEFGDDGARRFVPGFTQDEQELGVAAWVFACSAANLYDQAVGDATGSPLLWYQPSCGSSGAFESLHAGWSEALTVLQAGEAFLKDQTPRTD